MRSLATMILGASMLFTTVGAPCRAQAAESTASIALTEVSFTPRKETLEFVFRGRAPLTADEVRVSAVDGAKDVVNVHLDGVSVTRRWVQMPDAAIMRTLLHPAEDQRSAVLRIRLNEKVSPSMVAAARIREEGGVVVVSLPRSEAIAVSWLAAEKASAPVVVAQTPSAPPVVAPVVVPVVAVAPPPAPAAPESAPNIASAAPAAPVVVSEPPIGARPLALDEPETSVDEVHASANVAGESDSTGTGAAAMTLCLLLGGGFFLWRKIKHHRPNAQNGRLITPLSTHFLGPKQGLLLLDVAGEMVLLGTSEKGVQMLTKIERTTAPEKAAETPADRHARDAAAVAALATQAPAAPSSTATDESPKAGRAARLGAALEKVRTMNARKAEKLETADQDVTADALERAFFDRADEHLAEAANEVEDNYEPSVKSFFKRATAQRKAMSEEPAPKSEEVVAPRETARKPARAALTLMPTAPARGEGLENDILRKIRQLQGA
jgi:flagellar protein FliO/FliZ